MKIRWYYGAVSPSTLSRRSFLATAAIAATAASLQQRLAAADEASGLKGKINHSACKWCYPKVALEDFCVAGKEMGLTSVDLVGPNDFATLKKHGFAPILKETPGGHTWLNWRSYLIEFAPQLF